MSRAPARFSRARRTPGYRTPWSVKIGLRRRGERKVTWHTSSSSHTTESAARKAVAKLAARLAEGGVEIPRGWEPVNIQVSHVEYVDSRKGPYHYDNPLLLFNLEGTFATVANEEALLSARRLT